MSFGRGWALVAIAMLIVGIGLGALAVVTPALSDVAAYSAGMDALRASLYGDSTTAMVAFDTATDGFHSLNATYGTNKWVFADLAYAAFAWAALIAVAGPTLGDRILAGSRRFWPLFLATVVGLVVILVGGVASIYQEVGRNLVPEWADSVAIPLFGMLAGMTFMGPVVLIFVLGPVATRRRPSGLLALRGRGYLASGVATLVYAIPVLISVLCVGLFWTTGGWAISTGGAILGWLLLNARGLWIGPDAGPTDPDEA